MNIIRKLKGTGVALITPFYKDGSIDFNSFEKLINHIIHGKVEYLVILGTTGESVTLSLNEKTAILDFVKEINENRLPLVLGLGGNNTQEILSQVDSYNLEGIDAILSVSPYYNKPSQKGIYQHFKMIAHQSSVPVIIYNIPGRTGSNITAETTLALANDLENIIGIKEASGSIEQSMRIIKNRPKDFLVISGDDILTLPMIAAGADGVISVVANAFPKNFSEMARQAINGNYEKARTIHYSFLEIIQLLFVEGNPSGIKAALSILNLCQDQLRLPLMSVSKATYNKMVAVIETMK